jgi:hypothetical protein
VVFYHWQRCFITLNPGTNVRKLFTAAIYCHSMVFTVIIMFYNTEWQYDHGMAEKYSGKKFYNIGPRHQFYQQFICAFFTRMTKKPFWKTLSYEICKNFLLFTKKSFEEFVGDFTLFAIHFLPKFDDIDARSLCHKTNYRGNLPWFGGKTLILCYKSILPW